ncbi:hypothetical protein OAJ19_00560 [Pelagibacteraceae bacterium]|nr:hypothetical protein [Pelagibacteraceae bacterium]
MQSLYIRVFDYIDNTKPTHLGVYFSLLFHLSILLFAMGLPDFFKPNKIPIPQIIPIEILNISDVTSLAPKKETLETNNNESKKIKQKKFNSSENTEIQKINLQEKPKKNIIQNENNTNNSPVVSKLETKKIDVKEKKINNLTEEKIIKQETIETIKVNKIKPKLKPKPIEKVESKSEMKIENKIKPEIKKNDENIIKPEIKKNDENKIKPEIKKNNKNKIIDKPKLVQKPQPDFNVASLLKDLRNDESNNIQEDLEEDEEKISETDKEEVKDNSELQITLANLAMQQLQRCVSIDSGQLKGNYQINGRQFIKTKAKYDIEGEVVDNSIQIIDINISDKISKMIESSVIFALNTCNLNLPAEHYELWKSITMTFDVDRMLDR